MKRPKEDNSKQVYNATGISQNILVKEGGYEVTETWSSNAKKTGSSKITKENSSNKSIENAQRQTNQWMQMKQTNFGVKYGNRKNITERLNCKLSKKDLRGKYIWSHLGQYSRKNQIEKHLDMMEYMDSGLKDSCSSPMDWL